MSGRDEVRSPDGAHWRVRRRWLDRPMPNLQRRFRANLEKERGGSLLDLWGVDFTDSIWVTLAAIAAILLVVFVLLPLIGVAIELILLFFLLGSGLVGRLLLRRPWIVEAENLDKPDASAAFAVRGWRRSSQAIDELRTRIASSGLPEQLPQQEP